MRARKKTISSQANAGETAVCVDLEEGGLFASWAAGGQG